MIRLGDEATNSSVMKIGINLYSGIYGRFLFVTRCLFVAYLKSATMGVGLGASPTAHLSERS